jgi:ornithine carbamoyltransferase
MLLELHHRSLWSGAVMRLAPLQALIDTAVALGRRGQHNAQPEQPEPLKGAHVAVLCAQPMPLLDDFGRAVVDLGAELALLNGPAWLHSAQGRIAEAAHVLGRLYNLVDVSDVDASTLDHIEQHAHVPVLDGLSRPDHEFHLLAELMTMREAAARPFEQLRVRIAGEPASPLFTAAQLAAERLQVIIINEPSGLPPGSQAIATDPAASFVLDPTASIQAGRLTVENAPAVEAARWVNPVARNRRLLLRTAVQAAAALAARTVGG